MLTNMTSRTNRKTSSVIVRAVCARVCAGRRYNSLSRKKGYWVGSTYFCHEVHRSVEDITAAWASVIFDEPTASRTNHFGFFFIGSYPPGSLRLLTIVGATSGREAGGGTIRVLLCVMALLTLAFGWLVLCIFLLVPRRTTLWQSIELAKSHCQRVYGQ
jgi:hypothetical protein